MNWYITPTLPPQLWVPGFFCVCVSVYVCGCLCVWTVTDMASADSPARSYLHCRSDVREPGGGRREERGTDREVEVCVCVSLFNTHLSQCSLTFISPPPMHSHFLTPLTQLFMVGWMWRWWGCSVLTASHNVNLMPKMEMEKEKKDRNMC